MVDFFKDFVGFIIARKKFVLGPIILFLLLFGYLLLTTEGTVIAPFVYTLF